MELYRHLDDVPPTVECGAVSIGNFDGVHRGHARILKRLCHHAGQVAGPSIVFTFDPHPVRLLRPENAPPPLTWTDRKADLLAKQGIDVMVVYPTDVDLLEMPAQSFFQKIVRDRLAALAMVEGPNFFFGHGRAGDVRLLGELCRADRVQLEVVEPLTHGNAFISSSRVRELLRQGTIDEVTAMLTEPYRIRGMVTHGAARGATIGFPTANIDAIDTLLPGHGVYAGRAYHANQAWPAAINIGPSPTFGVDTAKVEAHLIGFNGPLYGRPLEVDFLSRLRGIRSFDSVVELQAQLAQDVQQAQQLAETANS